MTYWLLPLLLLGACSGGDKGTNPAFPHNPTPYALDVPAGFPLPEIPANNPLTIEGVELGRLLFTDPILSVDSTVACASCHLRESAFADARRASAKESTA